MIKFTKMHGLGNDFIVINTITTPISPDIFTNKKLSHRHLGIGFDQALLIGPSTHADFSCQIFNADGTEAEQCGNGMRCVARFIHEEKLSKKNIIRIETKAGIMTATIQDYDHIQVAMGIPIIQKNSAKLIFENDILNRFSSTMISMGNPHIIFNVPAVKTCPINEWGLTISQHALFPQGINVGFMEIIDRNHIRLRTYERGSGETYACGSNACAAVVAGINNDLLDSTVKVELAFGNLLIEWDKKSNPVLLTGPASRIFDGNI